MATERRTEEAGIAGEIPGAEQAAVPLARSIFEPTGDPPHVALDFEHSGEVKLEGPSAEDIAFYRAHLAGWREHTGEHVLVYEGKEHGFYPSRKAALKEGYRRFGRVPFLAKRVDPDEKPRPVARVIL